jgi:hypothetical protein
MGGGVGRCVAYVGELTRARMRRCAGLLESMTAELASLVDGTGRTCAFEDNLLRASSDSQVAILRAHLAAGDGGELSGSLDGGRPDAHAAHSSSALALNAFGEWLGFEPQLVVDGVSGFTNPLRVEARQRICRGGWAPDLDCLLTGPSVVVGIESKLTGPPATHPAGRWSDAYGWSSCRALLDDGWLETLDAARSGEYRPIYLDADQLLKHALGLSEQHPDRDRHLVSVYWEPDDGDEVDQVTAHRGEVAELLDRIGHATPHLHALTYAERWAQWEQLNDIPWLPEHLAALRDRYARPLAGPHNGRPEPTEG